MTNWAELVPRVFSTNEKISINLSLKLQRDGASWAPTLQYLGSATRQLNKCHLPTIKLVCYWSLCVGICIPAGLRADSGPCWPIVSTEDAQHKAVGKNND